MNKTLFIFSKIQDGSQEPVYINKTILSLEDSRWQLGTHLYKQNHSFSSKIQDGGWEPVYINKTILFLLKNSRWWPGIHFGRKIGYPSSCWTSFICPAQTTIFLDAWMPRILSIHIHITATIYRYL